MKKMKHLLKVIILLCVIFFTACGKNEELSSNESNQYNFSSYIIEESDIPLISTFVENMFYYIKPLENGHEIRVYDMKTQEDRRIHYFQEDIATGRSYHLIFMSASADGRIALLNHIHDESDTKYEIITLNIAGNVLLDCEITEYFMDLEQERAIKCMALGEKDMIYLALSGNSDIIIGLDEKGKEQLRVICEESVYLLFSDRLHQVYGVCESTNGNKNSLQLWKLDLSTRTFVNTRQTISHYDGNDVYVGESQGVLLISEGNSLSKYDMKSGEKETVLHWVAANIDYINIKKITVLEGNNIGVLIQHTGISGQMPYNEIVSLNEVSADVGPNEPEYREKITLVYATMHLDHEMNSWIVEFNRSQEDYQIEVKDYGQNGYEAGLMNLNKDMITGNIPDLIDLNDIHIGAYISKGILADLYPFLDADPDMERQDFVSSMLRLYEDNGKIYGIAPSYRLETLMGKETVVGDASDWTTQKMRMLVETMPEDSSLIDNLAPEGLLRMTLAMGMDEYVNWEDATCSFDSDDFIQLLELAASIKSMILEVEEVAQALSEGSLILNRAYIYDVNDYKEAVDMFQGEESVCVGYPSPTGGSAIAYTRFSIGISNVSENKEAAWQFVRSLLEEDFQDTHVKSNFPLRISSLEKKFEQKMETQGLLEPFPMYSYTNSPIVTLEEIEALYEVINTSRSSMLFDENIWNVIEEETEHYFGGNKTAEQTAQVIQNRVEIYMNENF